MLIADGGGWTHRVANTAPARTNAPPPANTVVVQLSSGPRQVTILPGATPERPLQGFIGPLSPEMEVLRSGPPRPTNLQQVAANAPQFNPQPGAPPDRPLQGFIGPLSPQMEVLRSGPPARPLEGFMGPLSPQQEVLRSGPPAILPRNVTEGSAPKTHPTAGLASDDPRAGLIDQGYQLQEIDQQARALAGQPIDIEAAKKQVQKAQAAVDRYLTEAYTGLKPGEKAHLALLARAIDAAPESGKLAALQKFESALASALKPEQQTQLRTLQRGTEDAHLKLEGQLLGKELRTVMLDGGFCGNEAQKAAAQGRVELVMVDARVHVAQVRETAANRRLQDAQLLLLTPQNKEKLAPQQQKLADAVRDVQLNPQDTDAQQRLTIAQTLFDGAFAMSINSADKRALDALQAGVLRESALGQQLENEAVTVHQYDAMSRESQLRCGALNPTEQRILDLAKADYDIVQKDAEIRRVALEAASAAPERREELLQRLDGLLVDKARLQSSADVNRSQFNRDVAVHNQQVDLAATVLARSGPATLQSAVTPVGLRLPTSIAAPAAGPMQGPFQPALFMQPAAPAKVEPLQVAAPFAVGLPSFDLSVDAANRQVDAAVHQRDALEKLLQPPPPPKPSGWDHALSIGMGVLQVAGGLIIAGAASWTGVGLVAGGLIAADGLARLGHAVSDAANGTSTDTWQSQGLQKLGMDRGAANRTDAGISLVTTFAAPTSGAARLGLLGVKTAATTIKSTAASYKAASIGYKVAAGYAGVSVADMTQAQFRYAAFNHDPTPFTVRGLVAMGVSPTAANYLQFGGLVVAQGGMVVRGPGTVPSNASATQASAAVQTGSGIIAPGGTIDGNKLVVIGGGHGGLTILADTVYSRPNAEPIVLLTSRASDPKVDRIDSLLGPVTFKENIRKGEPFDVEFQRQHFGYLYETSGASAITAAGTIVVTLPDIPRLRIELVQYLGGLVRPGQTIVLTGAGTPPAIAKLLQDDSRWRGVNVALVEGLPYGTRWKPEERLIEAKRKLEITVAFWGDPKAGVAAIREMFPLTDQVAGNPWPTIRVESPLKGAFMMGYSHTVMSYWPGNLDRTRAGEKFSLWTEGDMLHDRSLTDLMGQLDQERTALMEVYGLEGKDIFQRLGDMYQVTGAVDLHDLLTNHMKPFYKSLGETSPAALLERRYTTENYASLQTILWLAERAGFDMPVTKRVAVELEAKIRAFNEEIRRDQPDFPDVFEKYGLLSYREMFADFEGGIPEVTRLLNSPDIGRGVG